jgi:DNA-3-methyladenine glycosylase I
LKLWLFDLSVGLSWSTILNKKDSFKKAFRGWNFCEISKYTEEDLKRLMVDTTIIRNERKIRAVINNAKCTLLIEQTGY